MHRNSLSWLEKKTHATLTVDKGMLKIMINYALYLAHNDAYFHINDDAEKYGYLASQKFLHIICLPF